MDFKNFLLGKETDFKGRMIDEIWSFTDVQIETNHDFIQILFPLNKKSQSSFHGYYLETDELVQILKNDNLIRQNIIKSSEWFLSFLKRHDYWKIGYNHNQLRITRIIECLRLIVDDKSANEFYESIINICDPTKIDKKALFYWENALL